MAKDNIQNGGGKVGEGQPSTVPMSEPGSLAALTAIVENQARQIASLQELLIGALNAQRAVTPDSIWAKQQQQEMAIKEELDRLSVQFQESCQIRTQYLANEMNLDCKRLFKVSVGWSPEIVMRANDEIAAKAYYDKLCGILAVSPLRGKNGNNEYVIVEVTNDPAAQAMVAKRREPLPQRAAA